MTDLKVIEEKLEKKQALTPEEEKVVMGAPPDDHVSNHPHRDDDAFADIETVNMDEEKKPKENKAEEKPPEVKKEEAPVEKADNFVDLEARIEAELNKPEGQQDMKQFSKNETGLYLQMKRDRRARQKAEEERDALRFQKVKEQAAAEIKAKEVVEEVDPFAERPEDDIITIKDLKNLTKSLKTPKPVETKPLIDVTSPLVTSALAAQEREARKDLGVDDFDEVMECSSDIIGKNPSYARLVQDTLMKGDNVPKLLYSLIKGDPEYTKVLPLAKARLSAAGFTKTPIEEKKVETPEETKKKTDALAAQKKIEDNTAKPKTSAHAAGSEGKIGDYEVQDLLKMSDREFSKLPKKVREEALKRFGV